MIICFEGPDCAGKTTQAKLLVDYIMKNYDVPVEYKHFPDMGESIKNLVMTSSNPFFNACAFMFDMGCTMKTRHYTGSDRIIVLDRYYFSSLIMCTEWKNKYTGLSLNEQMKDEFDNYLKTVFGFTGMTLQKMELPPPDLTFVIMPDYSIVQSRLAKKADKDAFETDAKQARAFYTQYQNAINNLTLFKMNNELTPPIIIRDTRMIDTLAYGNTVTDAINSATSGLESNTRTVEDIHSAISVAFDYYMSFRYTVATSKSTSVEANILKAWKDDKPEHLRKRTSIPIKPDEVSPIVPITQEATPLEVPTKQPKTIIDNHDLAQTIQAISDNMEDVRLKYKFSDTQYYIYLKLNLDPKLILDKWDELILSDEYLTRDRLMVIETMIKILDNDNTRDQYPNGRINDVIRYLRREIEDIGAVGGDKEA